MRPLTLILLLLTTWAFGQPFTNRTLSNKIEQVTIFLEGAQVTRTGNITLPTGKSTIQLKDLSPYIDGKSVQVKATGSFTVLSVNHNLNYLSPLRKDERVDSITRATEKLELQVTKLKSRKSVLAEKHSLLNTNKKLGGESGTSLTELKQAIVFYDEALSRIKTEELSLDEKIDDLNDQLERLYAELALTRNLKDHPTGEVLIKVEAKTSTKASFEVSYFVGNAGWHPKYDIRVENVEKPLQVTYKADVFQSTGVSWDNVKLKLSNANPNLSSTAPQLYTWFLNYTRNTRPITRAVYNEVSNNIRTVTGTIVDDTGEPLPGVNVVIKGTTVGTVSDLDGHYSITVPHGVNTIVYSFIGMNSLELPINSGRMDVNMETDVQQLSEVLVTGYGKQRPSFNFRSKKEDDYEYEYEEAKPISTTTIQNQTSVEFEIDEPYTVPSSGEKQSVHINTLAVEALYEYYAVPKIDKDAFLIARLLNWDQYNLLEGEANLYLENSYVGRTILDARSLSDTLDLSLGRDKSIVIARNKVDTYSKRKVIGGNKIESRGFEIVIRNNKSQNINLTLFDQIPVPAISDISVSATDLSKGKLEELTGEVTWKLDLTPKEQKELKFAYEVKYPKHERVTLE
ncbi:MAG: hypothetical protein CMB80_27585 [Flammeovirgaceae bacterium]|nr:hypothetical protein [Flammeovirgaceae bacterium]HCX20381.1 hypothetical protein [Cytophagales bacterium]|tara:strand:- start:3684 stop:5561 length:1878 start_codon:yes stop_codon:yes gene_type:complete